MNPEPLSKLWNWCCQKSHSLSKYQFMILKNKILCPTLQCRSILVIIGLQCMQRATLSTSLPISFPELHSPWPAVRKWELWEQPFWGNKGNNRILVIWFTARSVSMHMPEMVALRALVFGPLVKGNKALGMRLALCTHCRPVMTFYYYRRRSTMKIKVFVSVQNFKTRHGKNIPFIQNVDSQFLMNKIICSILTLYTSCKHRHDPQSSAWSLAASSLVVVRRFLLREKNKRKSSHSFASSCLLQPMF